MLVCIPVVVFTWLARTSRTMHVRRGFSMRTVFPYGLRACFRCCFFVASRPLSPRGHVVVVGVVVVVRAFLVVVAGAAGSGELLVAVAGAAAGVGSR